MGFGSREHRGMGWRMKDPVLVAVSCLFMWHGIELAVPHHHADFDVPQERLACSASHPLSGESHLHRGGETLDAHPCFTCVVGSVLPSAPPGASAEDAPDQRVLTAAAFPDFRSHHRALLPLHRGPPATL